MKRHDVLEHEIVWDESGHLSEVAKSALADGQDAILPSDALNHFAQCHPCAESVGEQALLSAQLSAALAGERAPARATPWIPIAAALAIAALASVPRLSMVRFWVTSMGSFVAHLLRLLGRAAVETASHGFAPVLYVASTVGLLVMGFAVARFMPRMSAQSVSGKGFSS